jgi:hypothetical protein
MGDLQRNGEEMRNYPSVSLREPPPLLLLRDYPSVTS